MSKTQILAEFREAAARLKAQKYLSREAREVAGRMSRAFAELRRLAPGDRTRELEARVAELEARKAADLTEARDLAAKMKEDEARLEQIVRNAKGLWCRMNTALSLVEAAALTRQANEAVLRRLTPLLALPWSGQAREALETILRELATEGIQPGDRRQFKSVGAAQVFAYLNGAERVEPEHLEVLAHILWEDPGEQPEKVAKIVAKVANPVGMKINGLLLEVEQVIAATDVRNLAQAATATAKLAEIDKQLAGLKGNGRLEKARTYVKEQVRRIKVASIEAI